MNKSIKLILFLAIVSAISGLSIGIVNSFTAPKIEANAAAAEKQNLETIFPGGEFTLVEYNDEQSVVTKAYKVDDRGYVFKATAKGYNSSNPIVCLVGLDLDGKVIAIVPLSQSETSGVGSKCFEETNIKNLYIGREVNQEVDALSGATFTSKAMRTIVKRSQEVYMEIR